MVLANTALVACELYSPEFKSIFFSHKPLPKDAQVLRDL
jgi:hypothetical protein